MSATHAMRTLDTSQALQRQLCFALYSATHAVTRSYRSLLANYGLTYPQYLVVLALMETPSMTSGDIARVLRLDPGTLTPLLKRLSAAGLITRNRRKEDERVVDIELTEQGWALHDGLCEARRTVERRMDQPPADIEQLRAMLQVLTAALSETAAA